MSVTVKLMVTVMSVTVGTVTVSVTVMVSGAGERATMRRIMGQIPHNPPHFCYISPLYKRAAPNVKRKSREKCPPNHRQFPCMRTSPGA